MRSFRSKPVGWQHESYRHYLAAKGIRTSRYYSKESLLESLKRSEESLLFRQREENARKDAEAAEAERKFDEEFERKWGDFFEKDEEGSAEVIPRLVGESRHDYLKRVMRRSVSLQSKGSLTEDEQKELRDATETLKRRKSFFVKKDIVRDFETGLKFEWSGGHTVSVYDESGKEIDVRSIGDWRTDVTKKEDFDNAVKSYLESNSYEDVRRGDVEVNKRWDEILRKRSERQALGRGYRAEKVSA